ncbi:MAG: beta-lactamase family protein [Anaerolineae bacterium]|nr:beta-lactamase family protein [Anaerolineae bacterium]
MFEVKQIAILEHVTTRWSFHKTRVVSLSLFLLLIPIMPLHPQDYIDTLTARQQAEIEEIIQETIEHGQVGTVVWVAFPTTSYSWAVGLASEANATPLTANDSFRIASNLKTFIAATLLLMQEDGLLDLDNPFSHYLPEIAAFFDCGEHITIRHLLNHTSSLYSFTGSVAEVNELMVSDRAIKPEELVALAANTPYNCLYSPGDSFNYSNTNAVIAAMVIEAISGHRIEEEIRTHILDPLAMGNTYFRGLEPERGFLVDNHTESGPFDYNPTALGNGDLISNGPDLIKFVQSVYSGEIFADTSSHDEMLNFVWEDSNDFLQGHYGLGIRQFSREPLIIGHGGNIPGNLTMVMYAPEAEITVIVLTSSDYSPDFDILATVNAIFEVVGVEW